ncbi:MAG: type VI secretion system contractile sheath large subunit [Candidatus Competibacteraceae bacterium]
MPGRMEFRFDLPARDATPSRRGPDTPMRVLLLGDFSGRDHREAPSAMTDLASRRLHAVDIDNLNAVMARLAPKLHLPLGGEAGGFSTTITFMQLDDFHPDALYQRLDLFQALRRTRARLLNPASFAQAVAELTPLPGPEPAQAGPPPAEENEAHLLERLLGRTPATPPPRTPTERGTTTINTLLQTIVQPHIVHTDPHQAEWIAAVDTAISDQLRAVLHHPTFQALEAVWRGVHGLVANLEGDNAVRIYLLDVTQQELLFDLKTAGGDPKATGLYTLLIDQGVRAHGGQPWSLLVGDYTFDAAAEDIALLAMLGTLGAYAGGPFLAAAAPSVLGCADATTLTDPSQWSPLAAEAAEHWRLLRHSAVAPWLGLVLPRVLLRLPYGRNTDPVEQISFEEMPLGRDPSAYLWGNPALVCARLLIAGFVENGWDSSPGDMLEIDDLPAHIHTEASERVLQPCAEVLLGERAMSAILARGLMPLLSHRQRNAVRLARFQSLADPPAALAGYWL